jgi:hypothetical protein
LLIVLGVHFFAANDIGLGIPFPTRQKGIVINHSRKVRSVIAALLLAGGAISVAVIAQIEGADRGIAPVDSTSNFEVNGLTVDIAGKTADQARLRGWREAQRLGWRKLWQRTHSGGVPGLSDGALDSIVSGIIVEDEQIGPNRYVARLGVLFDRVRAGQILGVSGVVTRSAPLLLIPVQWSGGYATSFEGKSEWQKAWARYKTDGSTIDYVRVAGTGADPLLLNVAQTGRPGRKWWRALLDQYGAADVLIAQVRLERSYPGGPVIGHFSARYGPDNKTLQNFTLQVPSSAGIPGLMDEGVKRIDEIYGMGLANGQLRPDSSLIIEQPVAADEIKKELPPEKKDDKKSDDKAIREDDRQRDDRPREEDGDANAGPAREIRYISIQFDTPTAGSVSAAESAVRSVPGVKSVSTNSLAVGGVSVMQVAFDGDGDMLRVALSARGYSVSGGGGSLHMRRPGGGGGGDNDGGQQQPPEE